MATLLDPIVRKKPSSSRMMISSAQFCVHINVEMSLGGPNGEMKYRHNVLIRIKWWDLEC